MAFTRMNLSEVLDDLGSRFIINIPDEELASIERICFQIEQAHWYYEDFVREENPWLPSFSLKNFCAHFFRHCPLLEPWALTHERAFADFVKYKFRVPVCGSIILDESLEYVLLVKGWNSRTWTFPRGKINKGERELTCAVREVMEEVGFDITRHLITSASTRTDGHRKPRGGASTEPDFFEMTIKEQRLRLYMAGGIPLDTKFSTKTRKEISEIAWHKLSDLPGYQRTPLLVNKNGPIKQKNHFYMLMPFMGHIKRWLKRRRALLRMKPLSTDSGSDDIDDEMANWSENDKLYEDSTSLRATAEDHADAALALKNLLGITANTLISSPQSNNDPTLFGSNTCLNTTVPSFSQHNSQVYSPICTTTPQYKDSIKETRIEQMPSTARVKAQGLLDLINTGSVLPCTSAPLSKLPSFDQFPRSPFYSLAPQSTPSSSAPLRVVNDHEATQFAWNNFKFDRARLIACFD